MYLKLLALLSLAAAAQGVISAQCEAESDLLANDAALVAAKPFVSCHIDLNEANSCTIDAGGMFDQFETLCIAQGGQYYEQDIVLDCSVWIDLRRGLSLQKLELLRYFYKNVGSCVGANCTNSENEEAFDRELFPEWENEFAAEGFSCDIDKSAGSVAGSTLALVSAIMLVATVSFF